MIRILQQDNRLTKIVFAVIIGFAVITMVITLVPGIFDTVGTGTSDVYATVHDPSYLGRLTTESDPVKQTEVTALAQRQLTQQRLPPFLLPYMEQRAGQILVQRAILKHEADRLNLQVSDADLARELRTGPFAQYIFPNDQYIGDDKYMTFVQNAFGTTRSDFESQVKQDMELTRLQALITGGVTVADNTVRDAYKTQGTKVKFDYAVISAEDVAKGINPSEDDLQNFFKTNAARYATAAPETRKIAYLSFDASALPGGKPQVTDADLQAYYTQHKDQYQVKDQVKVRHILIAVPQGSDAKVDAAAKAKAQGILSQIKSGGDFAKLAGANSDDPGSKVQGGELGWLDPGKTVPEFDKVAFSLPIGQTSDLVKTQFGYHIIQVEEKKTAHLRPLEEVKAEILPVLEQTKFGGAEQAFAKQLADEAAKSGIEKTAAAHNLHADTTDYVAKDGVVANLADSGAMLTPAFSAAKGAVPQSVATGDGYAVFQVLDVKPAHAPEFAQIKDKVAADFKEQQIPQLLNAQLNKLDDRAKVLNDLRKAAGEMNIPIKTSDLVGKDGQVPDVGSMGGQAAVAFGMDKGAISAPINEGRVGIVLSVVDKQEPTADDIAKNFAVTKDALMNEQREEIFRVYLGNLTDLYDKKKAVTYTKKQPAAGTTPLGG